MSVVSDAGAMRATGSFADLLLKGSAAFWFLVAAVGQWLFVAFIVGFYAFPTLTGTSKLGIRTNF
ncbi:MAG: hypothetical protein HC793_03605 [Aquincola sp.]|nr:hypothetical protein [Aquincola sp.]